MTNFISFQYRFVNGRELIGVPIGSRNPETQGLRAWLYRDDLELFNYLGLEIGRWFHSDGTVQTKVYGNISISIPRVLTNAGPGQRVHYLDGDSFNLQRTNLRLVSGASKYNERQRVREALARKKAELVSNIPDTEPLSSIGMISS